MTETASLASIGVGERLRYARLAQKITLEQVERDIHIRARYLAAVEEERYQDLPGDVFARGIIRTYGNYLGLDGLSLVSTYRQLRKEETDSSGADIRQTDKVKAVKVQLKDRSDVGSGRPMRSGKKGGGLPMKQVGCGVVILLLLAALWFFTPSILAWLRSPSPAKEAATPPLQTAVTAEVKSETAAAKAGAKEEAPAATSAAVAKEAGPQTAAVDEKEQAQEPTSAAKEEQAQSSVAAVKEEQAQSSAAAVKEEPAESPAREAKEETESSAAAVKEEATSAAAAAPGVVLKLAFTDKCWLAVYADDVKVYEGMLSAGDSRTFTAAENISVRYGEIAAVEIEVNGQRVPPTGEKGVADRVYTR